MRELKLIKTRITALVGALLYLVAGRDACCAVEIDSLREAVRAHENQYRDFSVNMTKMHWAFSTDQFPTSNEDRRIVQWQDCYYSGICDTSFPSKRISRVFRIVACDGNTLTTYTPPNLVEHQSGNYSPPARFQPYDILLGALGHEMTLSQFLSGDDTTLNLTRIEVGDEEEFDGLKTLPVRRVFQLPGNEYEKIIDLRLAVDFAYLPCWGESITVTRGVRQMNAHSAVTRFLNGPLTLMGEIRTTTYPESEDPGDGLLTVIQVEGEPLSEMPPRSLFELKSYVGNPKIRYLSNGRLQTESLYRPKQVKKEVWPPEITWLVINDIALGIWLVFYSMMKLFKFVHRLLLRGRGTWVRAN